MRPTPCPTCSAYWTRRGALVNAAAQAIATQRGEDPARLIRRYTDAVHRRHLDGQTLDTP